MVGVPWSNLIFVVPIQKGENHLGIYKHKKRKCMQPPHQKNGKLQCIILLLVGLYSLSLCRSKDSLLICTKKNQSKYIAPIFIVFITKNANTSQEPLFALCGKWLSKC